MQSLKTALDGYLKKVGLEKAVAQSAALHKWKEAVGDAIASNTTPVDVRFGKMTVKVTTPVWRQELQLQKKEIIEKLNNSIGKNVIKEIQFI